jgi:hypothetical protein
MYGVGLHESLWLAVESIQRWFSARPYQVCVKRLKKKRRRTVQVKKSITQMGAPNCATNPDMDR